MSNIFVKEYKANEVFYISPSQIGKFFDYPATWYKENVLFQKDFYGSNSTLTGTACHYMYEQYAKLGPSEFKTHRFDLEREIERDLDIYINEHSILAPELNREVILTNYKQVYPTVINNYLYQYPNQVAERYVEKDVPSFAGYKIGGTIDAIHDNVIVDYKTVSTKPKDVIPFGYKIQLLAYAYALDFTVSSVRLVYGTPNTKTLPARCFIVTEDITDEDKALITDTLKLMCESLEKCKEDKSLIPLIFKSYKLLEDNNVRN